MRLPVFAPKLSLVTATYQWSQTFQTQALPSVLVQQADSVGWEWIVINGCLDSTIAHLLAAAQTDILIRPIPLEHPSRRLRPLPTAGSERALRPPEPR